MLYKRNQPPLDTKKELKNEWLKLFYYLLISLTIVGIFYLIGITIDAICHHYSHQINYLKQVATDEFTLPILAALFTNPRSQRSPRFQSGGGIGEQRGENKRILFTLN